MRVVTHSRENAATLPTPDSQAARVPRPCRRAKRTRAAAAGSSRLSLCGACSSRRSRCCLLLQHPLLGPALLRSAAAASSSRRRAALLLLRWLRSLLLLKQLQQRRRRLRRRLLLYFPAAEALLAPVEDSVLPSLRRRAGTTNGSGNTAKISRASIRRKPCKPKRAQSCSSLARPAGFLSCWQPAPRVPGRCRRSSPQPRPRRPRPPRARRIGTSGRRASPGTQKPGEAAGHNERRYRCVCCKVDVVSTRCGDFFARAP